MAPLLSKHVSACIIGGGAAGMAAAQKLIEKGVSNIVILEAQDRIGGRIHTVKHDNGIIEIGAHWIHGEEGNVVHDFAVKHQQKENEITWKQTGIGATTFVRCNGEEIDKEIADEIQKVTSDILEIGKRDDFFASAESLGEYFTREFCKVNKFNSLGEELMEWQNKFLSIIDGSDNWFECSTKHYLEQIECPGHPVINWKNGYSTLITYFKEGIDWSKIFLSCPVEKIEWDVPKLESSDTCCRVTTVDGDTLLADHVIFTPSLQILKRKYASMFSPQLPERKLRAIEGLEIGVVDKIYLEFPTRWWPEGCDGFSLLRRTSTDVTLTEDQPWESAILGFYEVYRHPTMLCGWISGKAAMQMETFNEEDVSRKCMKVLKEFLGKKYTIPNPIWFRRSKWGTNEFVGGSYSFRSVESELQDVWATDLAEPVSNDSNKPVLCFAGEATHPHYFSTVHGAVESGWREAERIISTMSM